MVGFACSLRVAFVIVSVVILVLFFFLFVFFLGWLLSKENLGGYRPFRTVCVEAL
jgi:hypothetical protein